MKEACNCFELSPIFETGKDSQEYVMSLKCTKCGKEYSTNKRSKEEYLISFFESSKK